MPDSKTPDEPFDDIIEMFRNIAENGSEPTRAKPDHAAKPTRVARNDSAADAIALGEAASAQGVATATEPEFDTRPDPEPAAPETKAEPEPALVEAAAAVEEVPAPPKLTEGVVPVSTIEKLLAPTARTSPAPGPYVGIPKTAAAAASGAVSLEALAASPDEADTSDSDPAALAAVLTGGGATAAGADAVLGDDLVLTTALAAPAVEAPTTVVPPHKRDSVGRRRRSAVIVAGVAAAAVLVAGGAYALEHKGSTDTTADGSHTGTIGAPVTLDSTPTPTPTPSASASLPLIAPTPGKHTKHAVVPPSVAPPSSVPTIAASINAASASAAAASSSAALASASASMSAAIIKAETKQAKQYARIIASYSKTVTTSAAALGVAMSKAPNISANDIASPTAVNAFYNAVAQASHDYNLVRSVHPPAPLASAHARLLAAMAAVRTNLINGQNVALNGQNCSAVPCRYGAQRGWSAYTSTLPGTWSYQQAVVTWQSAVAKLAAGG